VIADAVVDHHRQVDFGGGPGGGDGLRRAKRLDCRLAAEISRDLRRPEIDLPPAMRLTNGLDGQIEHASRADRKQQRGEIGRASGRGSVDVRE
jgi:hypothetical protein